MDKRMNNILTERFLFLRGDDKVSELFENIVNIVDSS
jgi:hypothetical protein